MSTTAGHDEAEPADDRAGGPADAVGAEDRELRRGRAGQQAAGGVRVLELAGRPSSRLRSTHEARSSDDVRRRPAEAGEPDARPLARDRCQGRGGRALARGGVSAKRRFDASRVSRNASAEAVTAISASSQSGQASREGSASPIATLAIGVGQNVTSAGRSAISARPPELIAARTTAARRLVVLVFLTTVRSEVAVCCRVGVLVGVTLGVDCTLGVTRALGVTCVLGVTRDGCA